jgi:hypothetical protein
LIVQKHPVQCPLVIAPYAGCSCALFILILDRSLLFLPFRLPEDTLPLFKMFPPLRRLGQAIRKNEYLRGYTYNFIELFAPHLAREVMTKAMHVSPLQE